ncbi:MAG: hypothetical protein AAF962_17805 [Actinomycetota bacterium]
MVDATDRGAPRQVERITADTHDQLKREANDAIVEQIEQVECHESAMDDDPQAGNDV